MPSAFCLLHSAFPLAPLLLLWLALGLVGWGAGAQVPGILNNQGRLAINGTSFTGLATFKFALVVSNGASVGTLWSHNNTSVNGSEPTGAGISVSVAAGVFSVGLGDVTVSNMTQEIPPTVFTNLAVYLRTWVNDGVNGSQRLAPDWRVTSVGYALVARTSLEAPAGAVNFSGALAGDVTGGQGTTVVAKVGGLTAATLATGATRANAATNTSLAGTLVQRDSSGNFAAGTITARFSGDGSGLTNLPAVSAPLPSGVMLASSLAQDPTLISGGYRLAMTSPAAAWVTGSSSNAPLARYGHSAVWTGQTLLVWGGNYGPASYSGSGGSYSPDADTWGLISTVNAPTARGGHTTVWSGTEMIVWGGNCASASFLGTGARFAPDTQTWTAISTTNAPPGRSGHVAVWTGSRMLIWGGVNATNLLNDGALYDPVANVWTTLTVTNAPEARMNVVAVWAADRLVVWGGEGAFGELGTGAVLTFSNNVPLVWSALNSTNAPAARADHTAVWTGSRMLVWGGQAGGVPLGDGAAYNPSANAWQTLSTTNAPAARYDHAALWTGSELMIVAGANASAPLATSAAYDPVTGLWRTLGSTGSPVARSVPGVVWSGTEILLFGGLSGTQPVASLQRLTPLSAWYLYRKL
ncbi:MAG: hypothetical protein WCK27_02800 [Verrucomicrobiota bacterium]